jgi:eukaryotic-like serine/threonine-protein kinase
VEGETLAQSLHRGAMAPEDVVRIGQQMAEALDVAHDRGVVHRDLKPGNVMIRPDGRVKVLDFGLAKMGDGIGSRAAGDDSPTVTMEETSPGVILGTASYMSPEQAMGQPSDKRSDVYSFGAVVYEMVMGERLHRGTATTEVLASVIKDEPPWDRVPARFRRLLRNCLAKDPQQRLKHIGDAMRLAEEGTTDPIAVTASPPGPAKKLRWLWPVLAAALVAALGAAWWMFGRGTQKLEVVRFQILENGQFKLENSSPAVSPDGKWVAFQAPGNDGKSHIWLRALDSLESRPIPGTETPNLLQSPPFWSHDSKTIVFANNPAPFAPGQLKRVDIAGGEPQTICDLESSIAGLDWNAEGTILFLESVKRNLARVPATGGKPVAVTVARDEGFDLMPQFLPDGHTFLYHREVRLGETGGIYVGSLDKSPAEQSTKPILLTNRQAYYSPAGGDHLLFLRERTLFAQPFDLSTQTLKGQPVAVVDGVSSFAPAFSGRYSVSTNGVLAYNAGPVSIGQVALIDGASGKVLRILADLTGVTNASLAPDGKRVALSRVDPADGTTNIWVTDLSTGDSTKVTNGSGRNDYPVWSPDEQRIVFASNRQGVMDIYMKNADGTGEERLLLKTDQDKFPSSWSNGFLLYSSGADLWILPQPESGTSKPVAYLQTKNQKGEGSFSPDGKWVAYTSQDAGRLEVYIRPFNPQHLTEAETGSHWLVSRGGGSESQWTKGGRELQYFSAGRIMAQAVDPAKPYELKGAAETVAEVTTSGFSVSADGSKLLRVIIPSGDVPGQLVIVKNWQAVLEK